MLKFTNFSETSNINLEHNIETLPQDDISLPKVVVVRSFEENSFNKNNNEILVKPNLNPYYEDDSNKNMNTNNEFVHDKNFEKIKITNNVYYE